MRITKDDRKQRLKDVQQIMSMKLTGQPSDIYAYLQDADIDIPLSSVERYVKECRNANWLWLTDVAKHTYIANLRTRAEYIEEAIEHTMTSLRDDKMKPHARAMLNNSLATLSKEQSELIEGQGILRHWDVLINRNDTEWQKTAITADTSDTDANLT